MQFEYGPDREKVRQVTAKGTMPATIDYVGGGLYENWMTATGTAQKNYLVTPNGLAAVVTRSSNLPDTIAYFHQDNLGSIVALTDAHGNLVQRLAYDAYGQRIVVANPAGIAGFGTEMGYTGHVQLDDLSLIHMNGRVYDPVIGRFLSPDPNVQDPNNLQSLNRYSYVQNNPLSFTDPSGYFLSGFFHWFGHHWQMIAAVVVAVVASFFGQYEVWGLTATEWAAAGGFAAGLIASNGNLEDGLIGAAAAVAFYGIGSQFQGAAMGAKEYVEKVVEHGIVGGLQSVAEGGRFFSGFLSSAVPESASLATGDYAMFGTGGEIDAGKVVAAAAIGGTASMLGGGKFANGAVTGAFGEAFNEGLDRLIQHKLSAQGLTDLEAREGSKNVVYLDSNLNPTAGVGHLLSADELQEYPVGSTVPQSQVDAWLTTDVAAAEAAVNSHVTVPITQDQFDSLVSLTFNIGTGTFLSSRVLSYLNSGDYFNAAVSFGRYVRVGNNYDALVGRRVDESATFSCGRGC